jgi:hypothetical protein
MNEITAKITAGSVVTARPWVAGSPLDVQRGIVMVPDHTRNCALVWFPEMGDPRPGTVQGIFLNEIEEVGTLEDAAPSWVVTSYRACKRTNGAGAWRTEWRAAGFAIESAARATGKFKRDAARP